MFRTKFSNDHLQSLWKVIVIITVLTIISDVLDNNQVSAAGPSFANMNVSRLVDMADNGSGQAALEEVGNLAYGIGNFAPAPGDHIEYDPMMLSWIRGAVVDYDELPEACTSSDPRMTFDSDACAEEFWATESAVRFGPSFFTTPLEDGSVELREADDILATFIEETGHSWQEFQFETNGEGEERVRRTTLEDSLYWSAGREYQIKRYILNLDGDILNLSDKQRDNLTAQICNGYANPIGAEVPSYGAPTDWPNPEAWPVSNPSLDDILDLCQSVAFEPEF